VKEWNFVFLGETFKHLGTLLPNEKAALLAAIWNIIVFFYCLGLE
jgi:hypothetical protein